MCKTIAKTHDTTSNKKNKVQEAAVLEKYSK